MTPADIVILIVVILVVGSIIGVYIYKRSKGLPTGECSCCSSKMKKDVKKALKNIDLSDLDNEECTCKCNNCSNDKKKNL